MPVERLKLLTGCEKDFGCAPATDSWFCFNSIDQEIINQLKAGKAVREIIQFLLEASYGDFHSTIGKLRRSLPDNGEVMTTRVNKADREEGPRESDDKGRFSHTAKVPSQMYSNRAVPGAEAAGDSTEGQQAETDKEKLHAQSLQNQKMETIGRLVGGVAHDFNNMLGVILGYTELALNKTNHEAPCFQHLQQIHKASLRSAELTRRILAFARQEAVKPRILELNDSVGDMIRMLRRLIGEKIDLVWKPVHDLWNVKIDPSQLDQLLINLAINARDAISGTGRITIETSNISSDDSVFGEHQEFIPGEYVLLAMRDDGVGMSPEVLEHIFEPFFTDRQRGQGTGLGLATVYEIVKQNQGFVYVRSEPGQGSTFEIYLPAFNGEVAHSEMQAASCVPPRGNETVLLVEDERDFLVVGEKMLNQLGYTVLTAGGPEKAIRMVGEHEGNIQLLISDVIMPEMNGKELAEQLTTVQPALKYLFMSGYTEQVLAQQRFWQREHHFIEKPFSMMEIASKVRAVLDGC